MNFSRSSSFMRSTVPACVQKESCTPAKSMPVGQEAGWGFREGGGVRAGGSGNNNNVAGWLAWCRQRAWRSAERRGQAAMRAGRPSLQSGAGALQPPAAAPVLSPSCWHAMAVSIMWEESMEWM